MLCQKFRDYKLIKIFWVLTLSIIWMGCEELLQGNITILSPDNQIRWEVGLEDAAVITWQMGNVSGNIRAELMRNNESVMLIKDSIDAFAFEYIWTVPGNIVPGQGYSVVLESYDDSSAWSESKTFRIDPYVSDATLDVLRPRKNDRWEINEEAAAEIVWESENLTGLLDLFLYQEQTRVAAIADSIPVHQDTLFWTVPDTINPNDNYHIMFTSHDDEYFIIRSSTFRVEAPENDYLLTVDNPAGGTRWEQGFNNGAIIEWSSEGLEGTIKIDLMDADSSVLVINDSIDIFQTNYLWTVPLDIPAGNDYQIRLTSNSVSYVTALSKKFRIDPYDATPSLELTTPTRDNTWYIGKENDGVINWAYHNLSGSITIELRKQNSTILTISEDAPVDSGGITWTVPDTLSPGKGYQVYIESISNPELNDLSDKFDILLLSDGAEIEIITPDRKTEWIIGTDDMAAIEWTFMLLDSTIRIELYDRKTFLFTIEDEIDVLSGSYLWTVPDTITPGKGYNIHLVSNRYSEVDVYSENFSIIEPEASLGLIEPERGSEWIIAEADGASISWTSEWLDGTIRIDLYDRTNYVTTISDSIDIMDGSFTWTVPETIEPGKGYQVYLVSNEDPEINDMSSKFSINTPEVTLELLSPQRGDEWVITQPDGAYISWSSEWLDSTIFIHLYDQNDFVLSIDENVEVSDGEFFWTVPETVLPGKSYKIFLGSHADPTLSATSDRITISTPTPELEILSPGQNDEWIIGDPDGATISWSSAWVTGLLQIDLYQRNTFIATLSQSDVSEGSFTWTIPDTISPGKGYNILLTSLDNPEIISESSQFQISEPERLLMILTPERNAEWFIGDSAAISWSHDWIDSTVHIDLYLKNNFQFTIFEAVDVNQGSINWMVPDTVDANRGYRIYIQSTHYPEVDDLSGSVQISNP